MSIILGSKDQNLMYDEFLSITSAGFKSSALNVQN